MGASESVIGCTSMHLSSLTVEYAPSATRPCMESQAVQYYRTVYPQKFQWHEQQAEQEAGQVFRVAFMARARFRAIVNVQDALEVRGAGLGGEQQAVQPAGSQCPTVAHIGQGQKEQPVLGHPRRVTCATQLPCRCTRPCCRSAGNGCLQRTPLSSEAGAVCGVTSVASSQTRSMITDCQLGNVHPPPRLATLFKPLLHL